MMKHFLSFFDVNIGILVHQEVTKLACLFITCGMQNQDHISERLFGHFLPVRGKGSWILED